MFERRCASSTWAGNGLLVLLVAASLGAAFAPNERHAPVPRRQIQTCAEPQRPQGRQGPRRVGIGVFAALVVVNVAISNASPEIKAVSLDSYGVCTPLTMDADFRGDKVGLNSFGHPCMPPGEFARRIFTG